MSTKLVTKEDKEWTNIDYTNTTAYKTVKAFNTVGVFTDEPDPNQPGKIPGSEFRQLKRLRKLDAVIKPQKGPIFKVITHMHRQLVSQYDEYGKPITKEYLTLSGEFKGTDWADMEVSYGFDEGKFKNPKMTKVYKFGKRFDPETGQDLGKIKVNDTKDEYYIELPKPKTDRKKLIDSIIEKANGTFKETIHYYYKDLVGGFRDGTFSYEQFTECSIEELRNLSKRGAGAKGPGYYRDSSNQLRDKDGNLVQ